MKKKPALLYLLVLSMLLLAGCADPQAVPHQSETAPSTENTELSATFDSVIKSNLFHNITVFEERLLKSKILSKNEANRTVVHQVQMMDIYGTELATYHCETDDAYHISTLTTTDDGGFLFVLGFQDYAYTQKGWASDHGVASRIMKCDRDGKLQFDTPLERITGHALKYCFEKDGLLYFFGELETPETKTQGVYSATDIYMLTLDQSGTVVNTRCIAGSDFDIFRAAEVSGDNFLLSVYSQSEDGDFIGYGSSHSPAKLVITVSDQLDILEIRKENGRDYSDIKIGEQKGVPMYRSDPRLKNFDAGTPEAFIDYGEYYLIVSERVTGEYENTPAFISSIWNYTETVYSVYAPNGALLFRKAVDSSPDFYAMTEQVMNSTSTFHTNAGTE